MEMKNNSRGLRQDFDSQHTWILKNTKLQTISFSLKFIFPLNRYLRFLLETFVSTYTYATRNVRRIIAKLEYFNVRDLNFPAFGLFGSTCRCLLQ